MTQWSWRIRYGPNSTFVNAMLDAVAAAVREGQATCLCPSCGDAVLDLEWEKNPDGSAHVRFIGHPPPLCPEFARYMEDF